jgi:hypothetical protein
MPAGNVLMYGAALERLVEGGIDLDANTFVCTLHTSGYTPAQGTHGLWSDVSGSQLSTAAGYTAGGVALTSVTSTRSGLVTTFDAADVSWTTATFTAKYAVITMRAGGSLVSGDFLLGYFDLETGGGSVTAGGGTFTIQWNASGIFTFTAS